MHFKLRGPRRKKTQPGVEVASAAAFAIGIFIGLHGQNAFIKTWIWLGSRFNDYQ
jgi:hypothetical protein